MSTKIDYGYRTLTDRGKLFVEGYLVATGVEVTLFADGCVAIGRCLHTGEDIEIGEGRLTSTIAEWYVTW